MAAPTRLPHARFARLGIVALVSAGCLCAGRSARAEVMQRFAVIAGNDNGGPDTKPLLYAGEDARKVHEVLTRLGGVRPEDAFLLIGKSAGDFSAALAELDRRVRAATARGDRATLVVYYSGHAKDGELRLGNTRVALDGLRARVAQSLADVRITVIDSCRSGAVTRTKGAKITPAFAIEATSSEAARGTVFLTSSSFDEDAQESDSVGGSYFSHHLVNGLRGDADRSRDGRVTLSEAYEYAYARTVADTADSMAGAQHPTFSYDLKGNGDLVLAEYTLAREGLYMPAHAPEGTYYLVDSRGIIAAEIAKEPGKDRRIALRAGKYRVKRRLPDKLRIGMIEVPQGQLVTLEDSQLRDAAFSDDPVKGSLREVGVRSTFMGGVTTQAFFDQPTREALFPPTGMLAFDLTFTNFFRHDWVVGFDFATGSARGNLDQTGALFPFRFSEVGLGGSLLKEWPMASGRFVPFFGTRLAFLFMKRQFDEPAIPQQNFSTFSPGLVLGTRVGITRTLGLLARARMHYLLYNVDQNRSLGYVELGAALAYDF